MGQVWRATDTKLNRDVALKVLPAAFVHEPERLARFSREAEVLASLNHPNIAAIYGVEEGALVNRTSYPPLATGGVVQRNGLRSLVHPRPGSKQQSDTPRGAGGLMGWAVSKTANPWV
jgi:serine/threonine protein kinase